MDRFSTLQVFVRVVDRGSFTQAARDLGLSQSAVSKQVAALERRLGVQLLNRTSRVMRPTSAGDDLYDAAVRLLADLDDAESRIGSANIDPAGVVRLAMPPALGRMHIVPNLPRFFAAYPGLTLDLTVSERRVDLVREGVDVAVRVGLLDDSALVVRRIGSLRTTTVVTPAYLARKGTPVHPSQLKAHDLITGCSRGRIRNWRFKEGGRTITVSPAGSLRSDDAEDLRAAVLAGLGIGHEASALFSEELRSGQVVTILPEFAPDPLPIHAVCASGRRLPRRLRAVLEFLVETCAAEPSLSID